MRGSMKKRNKKTAKILAVVLAAALGVCVPETTLQAAETLTSVQIQMPGFVVEHLRKHCLRLLLRYEGLTAAATHSQQPQHKQASCNPFFLHILFLFIL